MQISKTLKDKYAQTPKKSQYLHSINHVLADELSSKFGEPKRFGFYLKMATIYNHELLRNIAGRVLESNAKKPGALFAYLIKKDTSKLNDSTNNKKSK